jgi:AraC-like DNA-binding protein
MAAILSDLLNTVRVVRSDWAVIELAAPGRLRFPQGKSAYVHFVLEGQLFLEGAEQARSTVLRAGAYVIILDGQSHIVGNSQSAPATETKYFQGDHALCSPPVLRFGGDGRLTRILSGSLEISRASGDLFRRGLPGILFGDGENALKLDPVSLERSAKGAGGMAFLSAIADVLLVQAVRGAIVDVSPSEKAAAEIFGTPQIGVALRLIDARPEKNWSVSSLASEVGMSRSVFAAAFRQKVGEPPMQYLTSVRVSRASQLLKSSTLSVVKIAHKVGYGSASSFARAFKQQQGTTPGVYRRSTRGIIHRLRQTAVQLDPYFA